MQPVILKDLENKPKGLLMKSYTLLEIADKADVSQKFLEGEIASGNLQGERVNNKWCVSGVSFRKWRRKRSLSKSKSNQIQQTLWEIAVDDQNNSKKSKKDDVVEWIDISKDWNRKDFKKEYSYLDLFSGAGGISLGFEMAGLKGVAAVEIMESAVDTHKTNFDHPVVSGDICKDSTKKILYEIVDKKENCGVDIIAGGFPCQGFSMSGYRVVNDKRNNLYEEMLDIVSNLNPKFIVMENVVGLRTMLGGKVEEKIIQDYKEIGYKVNVTELCSADYHTPQLRNRVIFIGNRLGKANYYPRPLLDKDRYLTTKDAIENLMRHPDDTEFNHVVTRHNEDMKKRLSEVEEGKSLYKNYADAWKKCPWDKPSCTIKENHGGVNIHPRLPRVLTAREMARIQSFPDNFLFRGTKKWQLVQIGNAVPPFLAKAIGLALRKSLESESKTQSC